MIINTAIFNATIEAAKTKAANRPDVLRAIVRAVVEIEKASYWSFADGVLTIKSTTSGKRYVIDGAHSCEARTKHCKHAIARLLMIRYTERLASAAPVAAEAVADERAQLLADVKSAWHRVRPFSSLDGAVYDYFKAASVDVLAVEQLKQIHTALTR